MWAANRKKSYGQLGFSFNCLIVIYGPKIKKYSWLYVGIQNKEKNKRKKPKIIILLLYVGLKYKKIKNIDCYMWPGGLK